MNTSDTTAKQILLGLLALGGIVGISLLFVWAILSLLGSLESELYTAIIAASATILASVLAMIFSKRYEHKTLIKQQIREQKVPVYETLISTFFETIFSDKTGQKQPSEEDVIKKLADLTPKLIVWGSQDVIRSWIDFRNHDWQNAESKKSLVLLDSLLLAIRKDLGNKSKKLDQFDLLKMFVNDLDPDRLSKTTQ